MTTTQLALAVEKLPFLTRAQALEEGERNPAFWSYLGRLMSSSDPDKAVDNEMKKAAIDALDPGKYTEAGAHWPMLQAKLREVRAQIADHLRDYGTMNGFFNMSGMGYTDPVTGITTFGDKPAETGGTDIWSTIGKVLSTVGAAAASIYTTKITTTAAKSIANTQAQTLTTQQQTQQAVAQQQALQQAQQQLTVAQTQGGTSGASIIMWVLLGLVGIGGLMFLMKSMKGR